MKVIWKYELAEDATLSMPQGAELLSVREQGSDVCLWALVDPDASKERRRFALFGTGHPIPDAPMKYVGTAHLYGGKLVVHAFELL